MKTKLPFHLVMLTMLATSHSIFGQEPNFVLSSSPGVGQSPYAVCAADVNGDGRLDLISADNYSGTLTVLTNDGSGGFVLAFTYHVGPPASLCVADVNGDGKVDLICADFGMNNSYLNTLTIMTNDGTGTFALASTLIVGEGPDSVCAADVNGDGNVDLICSTYSIFPPPGYTNSSYLMILTNDGSGDFQLSSTLNVLGSANAVCAADVSGDGKMDLITANSAYYKFMFGGGYYVTNALTVFTNDGSGNFSFAISPSVGFDPWWVIAADVNGDGKMDLISANLDNTLTVLTNVTIFSPPTFTPPLTIKPSGLGMQISWPSDSPGWSLEQNPDLTTANWNPSGYSGFNISDDGTNKSLTMPSPSGNLFFRLLHP